jgi:heat shock protein HtpX
MMNRNELEGVIAHELSHVGNRDILISTIIVVLVGFVSILSHMFLRFGGFGRRRDSSDGRVGAILMIVGIIFAILSPLIATIIRLAISRKRESLADASGVLLTRYPMGLASALEKIEHYGKRMQYANPATAHLFIASPFGPDNEDKSASFFERLFMTHPPMEERIKVLRSMK